MAIESSAKGLSRAKQTAIEGELVLLGRVAIIATLRPRQNGRNFDIWHSLIEERSGAKRAISARMKPGEMRARTETFAVALLKFSNPLVERAATRDIALQARRSSTSTAQNYSACTIAKSRRDFVAKLRLALEEADETARWLRLLRDADLATGPELIGLIREATELAAILGASCATAERNGPSRR